MNSEIQELVKEIKQSFRQMMDGAVAKSMRDKGVSYKLNWGATLPRLREKADAYGKNYDLAIALWKEDVRECKILATMIMPADQVLPEVIDIWMEQITSQEIAEQAVFNLTGFPVEDHQTGFVTPAGRFLGNAVCRKIKVKL